MKRLLQIFALLAFASSSALADMYPDASNAKLPVARTNLGLGTIATQNANAAAITGGSITNLTALSGFVNDPAITTALTSVAAFGNSTTVTAHTIRVGQTGDSTRDVVQSVAYVPSGTTLTGVNAFAAYTQSAQGNSGASANPVAYYSLSLCPVANSACWGGNYLLGDSLVAITPTTVTGVSLVALEVDYGVTSPNTVLGGISQHMGSSVSQPASALGFGLAAGSNSIAGVPTHFTAGFVCFDAATTAAGDCMILDPVSKTGTSIASQHVKYSYFDSSGARQSVLTGVNGGGVYQIQSTAGAGHAQLALDTVLLTQPGNGVLFGTDNVLASGSAGNLAIGAVGTFSNITIGTGTTGITAVGVLTIAPTSGPAELILNETGVNQAVVFYETAGSVKWQLGLNTDGSFFGYDNVHSASWLNVSTTGQVTLGEASPFSITAAGALATGGTPGLTHTCTITATQTLIFKNGLLTGGTC